MRGIFSLALAIALFVSLSIVAAQNKPLPINLNHSLRVKANPNEFYAFKIYKSELKPNKQYNIKLSWIGSVNQSNYYFHPLNSQLNCCVESIGVEMRIYWKSDQEDSISRSLFKPLDTEKLHFSTDSQGNIEGASVESRIGQTDEFQFTIVGYRNTRARDLEAKKQPFEYMIKFEEVVVDGAPEYVLRQFGLVMVITLILVAILSKSYFSKNGYLNKLFSNPIDDKKQQ